ncbi:MAG TPA: hypothetical protein VG265_16630, partial [Gaiellaceae bacterium]|nr:hypothetical protein [Gaiellaceae bacterium]
MPTVDFNALQAAGQPTAVTLRNDTSDAAAAVTSDFSQFDSVILEAVLETDFSGGAIQLVVEHSSDQVTWTTAATFTATG